ncbi:MAG: acetyl-CoA carboxylase, biotin carboxyl carrier protein [Elusimicrobia bacterium]|nr:acetyl-CoA carboxylase, biotin carboxyl carrier protein [Elusimicrobiota bacterium]
METKDLKNFLKSLKDTDIEELEVEAPGGTSVYLRKAKTLPKAAAPVARAAAPKLPDTILPIKSPMVGTFYNSQSKNYPPYVIEGNNVESGQKVGSIEAMKIMKDVTSHVKGKIVKILVLNGQTVEYGQELFLVDTSL